MSWEPSNGADIDDPVGDRPDDQANDDNRSASAKAAEWASRIMTISLEMVLPGLAGYWLDNKLGSKGLFMILGFAAGSLIAFKQLLAIAKIGQGKKRVGRSRLRESPASTTAKLSEKDKL
ncbi:AtpZ/AtpI family protein [Bythopirellula polymerisocia]|uniref:F0F1-ATPase subunit n=1 Tax=Bythopirellula polymerisocia TaxID=2528003 RepID=A0A5C6CSI7_9BACT|nr:AtpZ/AtpI family protein [Bythopirellula polymerisocia]TWU27348.1 hypothetical protein Pla144_21200 [Bythopirellula polymerisocia]